MAKYRLIKITRGDGIVRYSIQRKILFIWKEIDYEFNECFALNNFDRRTIKPKIEILKET